jgi:ATP-dependent Clp protease ATP-binding subunit ClpA
VAADRRRARRQQAGRTQEARRQAATSAEGALIFQRFTQHARQAVVHAADEARELRHESVRPEHLLLGVAAETGGLAARILEDAGTSYAELRQVAEQFDAGPETIDADALASIGIDLEAVRRRIDDAFGPGALERRTIRNSIPFHPDAKRVLECALKEAKDLHHAYIGTEHILLALASVRAPARDHLAASGLDHERLRILVRQALAA